MSQGPKPGWQGPDDEIRPDPAALDAQLGDLIAYCRAVSGRGEDAVSSAHGVLDSARSLITEDAAVSTALAALGSARSLLSDPDRLRAWLFGLARQEILGGAAPGAQEILDLVHQHAIRTEDLPIVLGIPANEADELLAAAQEEFARGVFSAELDTDPGHSEGSHDDGNWDDRAAAWEHSIAWAENASWPDGTDRDDVFGPRTDGWQDAYGLFRKPPESAGRRAAPGFGAAGLRRAFASGPVRAAAAAGIVVAVIGISTAYLAVASSPPPSQANHQTKHRLPAFAQFPATMPSPTPTATPTQTRKPVIVVLQPAPSAPKSTSPRPTSSSPGPRPSPTSLSPSPSPSPTLSLSPSLSPSPSPTATPTTTPSSSPS